MLANGYSFLGEKSKYVSVSPGRFTSISAGAGGSAGVAVALVGSPGEAVDLVYIAPGDKTVQIQTVTVPSNGKWAGVLA